VGDLQVDHVLPVVGAGLEDLAGLHRGMHAQAVEPLPLQGVFARQDVQNGKDLLPAFQHGPHIGRPPGQNLAQVKHPVPDHQAGKQPPVRRGERTERERADRLRERCHEISSR